MGELGTFTIKKVKEYLQKYYVNDTLGWYEFNTGTGNVEQYQSWLRNKMGGTNASSCDTLVEAPCSSYAGLGKVDWDYDFSFFCKYGVYNQAWNEYITHWIHINDNCPASDLTSKGIGIKVHFKDVTHWNNVYICSHDGATYSELDCSFHMDDNTSYDIELIYTAGVSIELLINGVSVGIKTNNLPSGVMTYHYLGLVDVRSGGPGTYSNDGSWIIKPSFKTSF